MDAINDMKTVLSLAVFILSPIIGGDGPFLFRILLKLQLQNKRIC